MVLAARAIPVVRAANVSPEPWQAVTADVLAQARPGDCVTFYPADARMAFQYYVGTGAATRRAPRSVLPVIPWGVVRPFVEDYAIPSPAALARRTAGCERMWLVSSHEGQANGPPRRAPIAPAGSLWPASFSAASAPGRCASTATPASSTSS